MPSLVFREESESTLAMLCGKALGLEFHSAALLGGGMFNTTYLVHLGGHEDVVLRLGAVNRHLLMPFEQYLMWTEWEVYNRCRALGLPFPEILYMDTSRKLVDRDYMFVRYVPGQAMSTVKLSPENYDALCADIGACTRQMHTLTAPKFGRVYEVMTDGGYDRWSEAVLHELEAWKTVGVPAHVLEDADLCRMETALARAVPLLDEIRTPVLVHNDLWMGNVLVRPDSDGYKLGLILDGDRAIYADPELEFSGHRVIHDEEAFLRAYGSAPSDSLPARTRRGLYHMLTQTWHSYVFFEEYAMPDYGARAVTFILDELKTLESRLDKLSL